MLCIQGLTGDLDAATLEDVKRRVPALRLLDHLYRKKNKGQQVRARMIQLTRQLVQERVAMGSYRDDFFSHLLNGKDKDLNVKFLTANATFLIIAGYATLFILLWE